MTDDPKITKAAERVCKLHRDLRLLSNAAYYGENPVALLEANHDLSEFKRRWEESPFTFNESAILVQIATQVIAEELA